MGALDLIATADLVGGGEHRATQWGRGRCVLSGEGERGGFRGKDDALRGENGSHGGGQEMGLTQSLLRGGGVRRRGLEVLELGRKGSWDIRRQH